MMFDAAFVSGFLHSVFLPLSTGGTLNHGGCYFKRCFTYTSLFDISTFEVLDE